MNADIQTRVRRIAADILDVPLDTIRPESTPETIESWDSLRHLNLMLSLEESFGVTLEPEEIAAATDIGSIARLMEGKVVG